MFIPLQKVRRKFYKTNLLHILTFFKYIWLVYLNVKSISHKVFFICSLRLSVLVFIFGLFRYLTDNEN